MRQAGRRTDERLQTRWDLKTLLAKVPSTDECGRLAAGLPVLWVLGLPRLSWELFELRKREQLVFLLLQALLVGADSRQQQEWWASWPQ